MINNVTTEGFIDATGEHPKEEHSSINKAATGETVNSVNIGNSSKKYTLPYTEQRPSIFPYNQVQETESGHIIEIDDTPGGERIMIKHRTGTGVELKADGSMVMGTTTNKIEVVQGSEDVIIEGNANLIYNSNVNMEVAGNFNMTVGGNYTTEVKGYMKNHIRKYVEEIIDEHMSTYIQQHERHYVGDSCHFSAENILRVYTDSCYTKCNNMLIDAYNMDVRNQDFYLHSPVLNIFGVNGAIGGTNIDHYGDTMSATSMYATQTMVSETFTGKLQGWADNAHETTRAQYAITAGQAPMGSADPKESSQEHAEDQPTEFNVTMEYPSKYEGNFNYFMSLVPILTKTLGQPKEKMDVTSEAVLNVDKYSGLLTYHPTTEEAISLSENEKYASLKDIFIADGLISE